MEKICNIWKKSWKWEDFAVMSQVYGLSLWVMAVKLVSESFKSGDDEKSG